MDTTREKVLHKKIWRIISTKANKYLSLTNLLFTFHNVFVQLIYGQIARPYITYHLTTGFADELKQHLDSLKEVELLNNPSRRKLGNAHSSLNFTSDLYQQIGRDIRHFDVAKHEIIDQLLVEIAPACGDFCSSPFIFVNVAAWKTRAQAPTRERGPTRMHRDGYAAGHFKCIVYVTALNEDMGLLQIGDKIISSENPGLAVIFQNSKAHHKAIPGKKCDRYTLDITMMRTLRQTDLLRYYPGTPDDRHLLSPLYAYVS
jgi:hypothetical protein